MCESVMFMCECGQGVGVDEPNMGEMLARYHGEKRCKFCDSTICCSCGYLNYSNLLRYAAYCMGCEEEDIAREVTALTAALPASRKSMNRAFKAAIDLAEIPKKKEREEWLAQQRNL